MIDATTDLPLHAIMAQLRLHHAQARILLAEDHPVNQMLCQELLSMAGLNADTAADGRQAVEMARSQRYDLILMDIHMPQLDGLRATELIRQSSLNRHVPILAMSANAPAKDQAAHLAAGMSAQLGKPLIPEALYSGLLRWLDSQAVQSCGGGQS